MWCDYRKPSLFVVRSNFFFFFCKGNSPMWKELEKVPCPSLSVSSLGASFSFGKYPLPLSGMFSHLSFSLYWWLNQNDICIFFKMMQQFIIILSMNERYWSLFFFQYLMRAAVVWWLSVFFSFQLSLAFSKCRTLSIFCITLKYTGMNYEVVCSDRLISLTIITLISIIR